MTLINSERLSIRHVLATDAPFILSLFNEPSFIHGIADKQVRHLTQATAYINDHFTQSYQQHGFGMYLITLSEDSTSIGICGLIRRDDHDDIELGYALSQDYFSQGYAQEAANAVLHYGRNTLQIKRVIAVTSLSNQASMNTLQRLGFRFEKIEKRVAYDDKTRLYTLNIERFED